MVIEWSEEQIRMILERYETGKSARKVAADFGVSYSTIYKILKSNGVKMRPLSFYRSKSIGKAFWEKVEKGNSDECWEWIASKNPDGYGNIWIDKKCQKAHRVSWVLHCGSIPENMHVLHTCDNPSCVNPKHLWLGTHQDNMRDRGQKGRNGFVEGESCHLSKLTENQVLEIRRLKKGGKSNTFLSKQFGVTSTNIAEIVNGKTWRYLL